VSRPVGPASASPSCAAAASTATSPGPCPAALTPAPILCLRYQGSAGHWGIAIYKASTGQYTESELPGSFGPATARQNKG
jgi:hypothetical protein